MGQCHLSLLHVSLVTGVHAMTKSSIIVHKTLSSEMNICHIIETCLKYVWCTWYAFSHYVFWSCVITSKFTHFQGFTNLLIFNSEEIINWWPIYSNQHCMLWIICYQCSSLCIENVTQDINRMNGSFISVFSGFIFTHSSAVGRGNGHALQCTESGFGITVL
jgi:hypothetical protein